MYDPVESALLAFLPPDLRAAIREALDAGASADEIARGAREVYGLGDDDLVVRVVKAAARQMEAARRN